MNNVGSTWWDKHIIEPHKGSNDDGSKNFVVMIEKRKGLMAEKCCYNKILLKFCWGKRRWKQEKTME